MHRFRRDLPSELAALAPSARGRQSSALAAARLALVTYRTAVLVEWWRMDLRGPRQLKMSMSRTFGESVAAIVNRQRLEKFLKFRLQRAVDRD